MPKQHSPKKRKMYENLTEIKIVVCRSHDKYIRAVYFNDFICFYTYSILEKCV